MRRTALATLVLLALSSQSAGASGKAISLAVPAGGGRLWLEVKVGVLARGQEVDVTTADGRELGTISPYGLRAGAEAGTYTLPVPADAARGGRVAIRVSIGSRAPTAAEVKDVELVAAP